MKTTYKFKNEWMNESVYSRKDMVTFINENNNHEFEMELHSILMVN